MFIPGPLEILLVILVSIAALIASRRSGRRSPWIIAACFGLAMVVTPTWRQIDAKLSRKRIGDAVHKVVVVNAELTGEAVVDGVIEVIVVNAELAGPDVGILSAGN